MSCFDGKNACTNIDGNRLKHKAKALILTESNEWTPRQLLPATGDKRTVHLFDSSSIMEQFVLYAVCCTLHVPSCLVAAHDAKLYTWGSR